MPIVIDTSITMAWCFEDEATQATDDVLDRLRLDEAVVPTRCVTSKSRICSWSPSGGSVCPRLR